MSERGPTIRIGAGVLGGFSRSVRSGCTGACGKCATTEVTEPTEITGKDDDHAVASCLESVFSVVEPLGQVS